VSPKHSNYMLSVACYKVEECPKNVQQETAKDRPVDQHWLELI